MRKICLVAIVSMLGSTAGYAQLPQNQNAANPIPEKPVDNGPTTPGANNAYQGGGVVLQGAPGAPAPKPEATPSGQTPANMVPPKQ